MLLSRGPMQTASGLWAIALATNRLIPKEMGCFHDKCCANALIETVIVQIDVLH